MLAKQLVNLENTFQEGTSMCLVLESLAKTLYQVCADQGFNGLDLGIVKSFAWQLLVALAEMSLPHVNIIHADLKPDNIMLVEMLHRKIKIVDFGSACCKTLHSAQYIQSRYYRAPEVVLGYPFDSAIDMWSVGCILFELHSGKPLFDGKDERDQIVYSRLIILG